MNAIQTILTFTTVLIAGSALAQPVKFSISTDIAGTASVKKDQRFLAIGQSVIGNFHVSGKEGVYAWYGYSAAGKFKNDFIATAKSISTSPQELNFKSYTQIAMRHISIGWKHYLKGAYNAEESWNLYFTAGFGFVSGRVTNVFTIATDTVNYNFPVNPVNGSGKFKRLTFDAALGYEIPIGMEIYLYGEARAWIPASDYPSKYLFINENAPFIATANIGLRVLFN